MSAREAVGTRNAKETSRRKAAEQAGARCLVVGYDRGESARTAVGGLLEDSPVPVTIVPSSAIDPLPSDSY